MYSYIDPGVAIHGESNERVHVKGEENLEFRIEWTK